MLPQQLLRRLGSAEGSRTAGLVPLLRRCVKLNGGPLKDQYADRTHAHFLSLDNDRLLKVYRQRAGGPAPGEDMGGWYASDGFCTWPCWLTSTSPGCRESTVLRETRLRELKCRRSSTGSRGPLDQSGIHPPARKRRSH